MTAIRPIDRLLKLPSFRYRGPCFCCNGDARHRLCDVIRDQHRGGDSLRALAQDFDLPLWAIRLICSASGQAYSGFLRRTRGEK